MKNKAIKGALLILSIGAACVSPANAQMTLTLTSGASTTGPLSDNGSGSISVGFGTTVGGWSVDAANAYGALNTSFGYTFTTPGMLFEGVLSSPASGTLTANLSESGFTAPSSGTFAIILNDAAGAYPVSMTAYINGASVGSIGTAGGVLDVNVSSYTTPFTLEEKLVYTANGSITSGNGQLDLTPPVAVPEPATYGVLAGLSMLALSVGQRQLARKA